MTKTEFNKVFPVLVDRVNTEFSEKFADLKKPSESIDIPTLLNDCIRLLKEYSAQLTYDAIIQLDVFDRE